MKKVLMAMVLMALFLVAGGGIMAAVLTSVVGGGVEQSSLYPIYGGIIVLTGVVVGASQWVVHEIKELKELLTDKNRERGKDTTLSE